MQIGGCGGGGVGVVGVGELLNRHRVSLGGRVTTSRRCPGMRWRWVCTTLLNAPGLFTSFLMLYEFYFHLKGCFEKKPIKMITCDGGGGQQAGRQKGKQDLSVVPIQFDL